MANRLLNKLQFLKYSLETIDYDLSKKLDYKLFFKKFEKALNHVKDFDSGINLCILSRKLNRNWDNFYELYNKYQLIFDSVETKDVKTLFNIEIDDDVDDDIFIITDIFKEENIIPIVSSVFENNQTSYININKNKYETYWGEDLCYKAMIKNSHLIIKDIKDNVVLEFKIDYKFNIETLKNSTKYHFSFKNDDITVYEISYVLGLKGISEANKDNAVLQCYKDILDGKDNDLKDCALMMCSYNNLPDSELDILLLNLTCYCLERLILDNIKNINSTNKILTYTMLSKRIWD